MQNAMALKSATHAHVPISSFSGDKVEKIFEEVNETGYKIVVDNNIPACMLISLNRYQEMIDIIEDYYLLVLSEMREKDDNGIRYTFEELILEDGLNLADVDSMEDVEIE